MKKTKFLLRTDFRSGPGKLLGFSRFLTLFVLVGALSFFQSKVNAQDNPVDKTSPLTAVTAATATNNNYAELQQRKLTGTVLNERGEPLAGATVLIAGTTIGAITDASGKFSLDVTDPNASVVISFVGYVTQQIALAGRATIDISMVPAVESIQEVVVVGYSTQKRASITGSVSFIKGDVVSKIPVPNITNAMAGQISGVITRQQGGEPGDDNSDIHIRGIATTGSNGPLIVVNGVIRNNLNQIDPSTIESVSVLKDAAAVAPYGMGGANGVILITTKSGAEGLPTLTYNMYYGIQNPTYYPHLLNAVDYMKLRNEAVRNQSATAVLPFDPAVIDDYANLHANDPDKYPDSNTKELVNFSVPMMKHDLQITGGTDKLRYFTGIGYFGQQGLFDKVYYKRYNFNLNLEAKVTNTTTVTTSFIGSFEQKHDLDVASSAQQLFRNGYKFIPTECIWYSNGLWGQFAGNSPVAVLKGEGYNNEETTTALTSIAIEQRIPFIKGLSLKGVFSYDSRMYYGKGWHTPFYYYVINLTATPRTWTQSVSTQEGNVPAYTYLTQNDNRNRTYTYQAYFNYNNTFGRHTVTGLVVAEARNGNYDFISARRNNFAVTIDEMNLGSSNKNDYDNGGSSSVNSQIGYVYRLGWNYDNKYMIEAAGRYDGHYYFAPGKRWGYFPSFSAGWRISEESFMQGISFLTNLKLRASWGKSGNLAGGAYQYLSGYTLSGNGYAFGSGTMVQQAYVNTESNPNITWEVSQKSDIGFEASLWQDLLTIETDFFYEKRTGMLLSPAITVPYEYGLGLAQQNAGKMDNFGFEVTLGTRKEFANGLRMNVNGNISLAKNKMVETFETAATFNNPNRKRTGRPYQTVFGYKTLGFFSTSEDTNGDGIINSTDGYNITQWGILHPGDIKYADLAGPPDSDGNMTGPDGKIDSNDECVIGHPQAYPLMVFGLTGTANWKGFDLSMFFQGAGMTSYNTQNFMTFPFFNNNSNADYEYYNDRWTPDNQDAKYPIAWPSPVANMQQASDFWQRNASYLRLKNVQFGYTIPKSVTQKIRIKNIRVYLASQNLLTISGLKFMDPESSTYNTDGTFSPTMKSFTIGANVTF
ncbi:MAG: TonB-dependent receptor [Bacteroidales bacterium]|nr:TonB-dependent receptor [Bacteroidales bacterium]